MKKHECIIGEWLHYENTELVNFEELIKKVKDNNETYRYAIEEYGFSIVQSLKLSDYFDRRKSTNLNHFNYCPYCGEKIDWKTLKIGVDAK